jgi:hypothetical protein
MRRVFSALILGRAGPTSGALPAAARDYPFLATMVMGAAKGIAAPDSSRPLTQTLRQLNDLAVHQ